MIEMTSKERMLTAMVNKTPDKVPVSPDISNMIPAKLTGKPFWDIYYYQDPPLWKAYIDAVEYFDFDGWFWHVGLEDNPDDKRVFKDEIISRNDNQMTVRTYCKTPPGELWKDTIYRKDNPPVIKTGFIKDLKKEFNHLHYFFPDPYKASDEKFQEAKKQLGNKGIAGFWINYPALMFDLRDKEENAYYDYYDNYELVKEFAEIWHNWALKYLERALDAGPDYIQTGHSGTLTRQSPQIFRDIGLKTLQAMSKMCDQAGVPIMLHSCGKEKELVKICAEETKVNAINPLEKPPMGDCNLAEIKEKYGSKIALMGNIHTVETMLKAEPKEVQKEVYKAIKAAGKNGGFILSTGDQCPKNTPEENLKKFIETGYYYGKYDIDGKLINI